jgi:hypothetical protein
MFSMIDSMIADNCDYYFAGVDNNSGGWLPGNVAQVKTDTISAISVSLNVNKSDLIFSNSQLMHQ